MKTPSNPSPISTTTSSTKTSSTGKAAYTGPERRRASAPRRTVEEDRRNLERVLDDANPRRDPERVGRRATDVLG